MKLSAWHKAHGDAVEWWSGFEHYDRVYMSRVFDSTYTPEPMEPVNADEIIKGGTGYGLNNALPPEIEHIYPDYSIYPKLTQNKAYGFLSRGCPRNCSFCIVGRKEGLCAKKVADLSEWWGGQKNIVLMDPNILACPERMDLLRQLAESNAWVDFNQGLDVRLLTEKVINAVNRVKIKEIRFAWDNPNDDLTPQFLLYNTHGAIQHHRNKVVYVLTNYNTTMQENLYRIYTLRDLGYFPFVMVFDKPNAPKEIRDLQRWCNNRRIFKSCPRFEDYKKRFRKESNGDNGLHVGPGTGEIQQE